GRHNSACPLRLEGQSEVALGNFGLGIRRACEEPGPSESGDCQHGISKCFHGESPSNSNQISRVPWVCPRDHAMATLSLDSPRISMDSGFVRDGTIVPC